MSVRILSNEDDTMAALYCSTTDWAFGPVVYTQATKMSAHQLMVKFLEFIVVDARVFSEAELASKWNEFHALDWKLCTECHDELAPGSAETCEKCLHECYECGERSIEMKKISRVGRKTVRMCGACEREYSEMHI